MPASTNDSSEEERGDVSQPKSTKTEAEAEEVKAFIASCFNEDVITQLKGSSLFDLVHKKSTGQVSTKQEDSDNQQMHHNEFQQFFERTYVGLNKMSSDGHGSGEEIETESFSQETKSDNYLEEFMQLLVAQIQGGEDKEAEETVSTEHFQSENRGSLSEESKARTESTSSQTDDSIESIIRRMAQQVTSNLGDGPHTNQRNDKFKVGMEKDKKKEQNVESTTIQVVPQDEENIFEIKITDDNTNDLNTDQKDDDSPY